LSVAENREFFAPEQRIIRHVSGKRHFPDITKCLSGSSIFFTMRPAPAPRLIGASDEIAPTDAASRAIWQVTENPVLGEPRSFGWLLSDWDYFRVADKPELPSSSARPNMPCGFTELSMATLGSSQ
jgi:hypothetical protein